MTLPLDALGGRGAAAGTGAPRSTSAPAAGSTSSPQAGPVQVMAYYFPQWHVDPRNEAMFGPGWTEWEVLRTGHPRFDGHRQPIRPRDGEYDESDPAVASRAVARALDHGVNGFIVDWYWFDNAPFLNAYLDKGLLAAERLGEFRFALMWANHEWTDLYPARHGSPPVMLPAPNTRYHAHCAFDHIIERYLGHPSYWRLGGMPYFSLYDLPGLVRGLGGIAETAALLDWFRDRAASAGLPGLHLNGTVNFGIDSPAELVSGLGLDSATHYTWWHHTGSAFQQFPTADYGAAHAEAAATWRRMTDELPVPYLPNVTVGWDPSPRTVDWALDRDRGYPFTSILTGNTAERLGAASADALEFAAAYGRHRVITINAWNEWTEGSYLEPDETYGDGYLTAVGEAVSAHRARTDTEGPAWTAGR
jgi:Glycosyltransferase WbsX